VAFGKAKGKRQISKGKSNFGRLRRFFKIEKIKCRPFALCLLIFAF
jgi:hypothetical protein